MTARPTCATCPHKEGNYCVRYPPTPLAVFRGGHVEIKTHSPQLPWHERCGEHPDMAAWIAAKEKGDG